MARSQQAARKRVFTALALAGTVALAGCYPQHEAAKAPYPNDYRERHPISIREGERTVEIFVGRNRGGLTPAQRADVLAFAQAWRHEATGGIAIEVPAGANEMAANDVLREVHSMFAASGVPQNGVRVSRYRPGPGSLASIRLNYSRLTAQAGPCGLWPDDLGPAMDSKHQENHPYWNLGCANQRSLAAMVDNPADLVQPRGETPVYSARRSVAIDKYRKGDNPGGTYNDYDKGKISDLGK
ncbi:MAG TPA: CpaD family pilus assembly protein [Pseudolabrys sp.]|nr:CpaD family pilus assembly protein [Pseudolabrys sp.]